MQNRPNSKLKEHMTMFIESNSIENDAFIRINSPEEIKLVDPACGSGHILIYAFELLTKIYEEEGYNNIDIPKLIIEKNLYGFEIDERAVQLTGFASLMKARGYHRKALDKKMQINNLCFKDSHLTKDEITEGLNSVNIILPETLLHDIIQIQQATNFGSLIIPVTQSTDIQNIITKINQSSINIDVFQRNKIDACLTALKQLLMLTERYHCVVTNPPYMSDGTMNETLLGFTKTYYPDSKADLMACFMERSLMMLLNTDS